MEGFYAIGYERCRHGCRLSSSFFCGLVGTHRATHGALSPLLAVAAALVSNYFFSGLAGAGLLEMGLRCLLAYVVLRVTAEAAKRVTGTMPVSMRYAAQMPAAIEFEEVEQT